MEAEIDLLRRHVEALKSENFQLRQERGEASKTNSEAGLPQSEEKFRLAFHTSPDSININRLSDGMYIDINEGFTRLTDYSREDVLGKTSLDLNIWADLRDRERRGP